MQLLSFKRTVLIFLIVILSAIFLSCFSYVMAFTGQPADSWINLNPTTPFLIVSQSSIGYDQMDQAVFMWGGHPPGGGYPQVEELFVYDIKQNKWRVEHPILDRPPNYCVSSDNVYDEANNLFIKLGSYEYGSHQWKRNFYLKDDVHTYDPVSKKWTIMRPTYKPQIRPAHGLTYDNDNQVLIFYGGQGATEVGTWVYDVYTNTWTKMLDWKNSPSPRDFPGLTYDREHKKTILFGGGYHQRDTWVYDIYTNKWTNMNPSVSPPDATSSGVSGVIGPAVTYDSVNKKVLAFVPIYCDQYNQVDGTCLNKVLRLEAWSYDLDANTWTKMSSKPSQLIAHRGGDVLATFLHDHNLALVMDLGSSQNCPSPCSNCSETWVYRYDIPQPDVLPMPPTNLSIETGQSQVKITWQASQGTDIAGYNIYRGTGTKPWQISYAKINISPITATSYIDTQSISSGNIYFYFIRSLDSQGRESKDSIKVRTQPQIIKEAIVSVLNKDQVRISWQGLSESDVIGYNIYRALCSPGICNKGDKPPYDNFSCPRAMVYYNFNPGSFSKINQVPVTQTTFLDNISLQGGGIYPYNVYAYIIKAVNNLGIESGPSPYWPTIPSAPVQLKFKEDVNKIDLKWLPNKEENIQGYRVYRIGPSYDYIMTELTSDIIQATSFTDPDSGNGSHISYYITAIDALGQEGIPSARALIHRGYKYLWDDNHYLDDYYIQGLLIDYINLPTAIIGSTYNQTLSASGGTKPYSWSVISGNLPSGLSMSSDEGYISGVPTVQGKYSFTVKVADSSAPQDHYTKSLSINVVPEGTDIDPPAINQINASGVTSDSAIITWNTDEPATSQVEYGTTLAYGIQTAKDFSLNLSHMINLGNLSPNSTYYYRVISEDKIGNIGTSSNYSFKTVDPGSPPSVTVSASPNAGIIPLTINFSCSITAGSSIASYDWDLGDGTKSNEENYFHTYNIKGFYVVSLTVTDINGKTGQGSAQIYIYGSEDELQIVGINPSYCDMVNLIQDVSYRPQINWSAHKIIYIPPQYVGLPLIRTSYNDKDINSSNYLSFTISKKANVFVAYDGNATPPNWLTSGFSYTGYQLGITHDFGPMNIWEKTFDNGTIMLGGNAANGASGYDNMYVVFIEEYSSEIKPNPPAGLKIIIE